MAEEFRYQGWKFYRENDYPKAYSNYLDDYYPEAIERLKEYGVPEGFIKEHMIFRVNNMTDEEWEDWKSEQRSIGGGIQSLLH